MEVVDTCNRIFCRCPVLAINEINSFFAKFFVFWKKERWLFLTSCITTPAIGNHVDIIYKMFRRGILDLDVLCLKTYCIRNLVIIIFLQTT